MLAFIGSRTTRERQARGAGLSVCEVDAQGRWHLRQTVELTNPSYLVVDADRRTLHTVHGDLSDISAFSIGSNGLLVSLNQRSTHGRNPVHLAWSERRTHLVVANYASATLTSLPVAADGTLGEAAATLQLIGTPGPRRPDQTGSHPHQVLRWPGSDRFVVPDKGLDRVHLIDLDGEGGLHLVGGLAAAPGAGCRHAVHDAARSLLWVANELDSTVMTCRVNVRGEPVPTIDRLSTVSLRPAGFEAASTAAGIVRRGDMLHVSNRGLDAIVSLRIDPVSGHPLPVQVTPTHGRTPRFITLSPDQRHLLVANEGTDCLWRFPILDDGRLGEPDEVLRTGSPVCIAFLP